MNTLQKLQVLSKDSQYDLACSCGTNKDDRRKKDADGKWIYPVSLPNGGKSILYKTLLSNACQNDCKYCPLRKNTNVQRCTLSTEEIVKSFLEYQQKHKLIGLFLSSGIIQNSEVTMQKIVDVASILRKKYQYKGFIHLKAIPGASEAALEAALSLATTVSLNIETAGVNHFSKLSDKKDYLNDIIEPLKFISKMTGKGAKYSKVKSTTQFIVGASDETDSEIVKYMFGLYDRLKFNRIYFSAYQAGLGDTSIPGESKEFSLNDDFSDSAMREHRLYQADFLMRQYNFKKEDFFFGNSSNFNLDKDPKEIWADNHPELYPMNINSASKEELLKVPGLGPTTKANA